MEAAVGGLNQREMGLQQRLQGLRLAKLEGGSLDSGAMNNSHKLNVATIS